MKTTINIFWGFKALVLFLATYLLISCNKQSLDVDSNTIDIPEGYSAISISTVDIESQEENLGNSNKSSVQVAIGKNELSVGPNVQSNSVFNCTATLEPVSETAKDVKSSLKEKGKSAQLKTDIIQKDIKYRVYAYNTSTGKLATSKSYIRGKETQEGPLMVVGGTKYTIVAYSINSKEHYPAEIENASDINTATISNQQVEFMFQKQDVDVKHNSKESIKLKLRHQFAQINTIIKLDEQTRRYASIRGAGGASYIKPSYSKTKFKVSNETITAANADLNNLGAPVEFPFIDFDDLSTYEIVNQKATILNTPSSITEGKFTIEALTIGDISRRVDIEKLNIKPGVKYNLVLTFNVPETTILGANPYFHFVDKSTKEGEIYTHTIELENPTYGAQIDLWYLDNSFNLTINGQDLFTRELNFEGFPLHDVYFSDNTYYGYKGSRGDISVIYWINQDAPREETPVVRLTIDENGNLQLFGRKKMSENLRELFIRNTTKPIAVNPNARLNPNGKNILTFSSKRWTITDIEGKIYGIRRKGVTP